MKWGGWTWVLGAALLVPAAGAAQMEAAATRWVVAGTGNEARYRVREQLAGFEFPNDAVGRTSAVTGVIVIGADGVVDAGASRIEIDLATLESDESRRDGYLRRNTLTTEEFPTATFVPREIRGLPSPLPSSGSATLELVGDLTVREVTRPVTWSATSTFGDGSIAGSAETVFTFEEMGLTKPSLARLLSVADTIKLEYDFRLVAER